MSRRTSVLAVLIVLAAALFTPTVPEIRAQESLDPGKGRFLVASRSIQDPRFQESVVLLLSVKKTGALGVIINKPSGIKLSSFFKHMRKAGPKQDRIYFGGPVEQRTLLLLLRTRKSSRHTSPVLAGVRASTDLKVIEQSLRRKHAGTDYRLFMGYAGWIAGQLEHEIRRGDWYVVEADAATVFHKDENEVWPKLIRKGEEILVWERGGPSELLLGRRLVLRYPDRILYRAQ